jgi:hypothetical protein
MTIKTYFGVFFCRLSVICLLGVDIFVYDNGHLNGGSLFPAEYQHKAEDNESRAVLLVVHRISEGGFQLIRLF